MSSKRMRRRGFSVLEIMVVIVIIGLLAGGVAISVGSYTAKVKLHKEVVAEIAFEVVAE